MSRLMKIEDLRELYEKDLVFLTQHVIERCKQHDILSNIGKHALFHWNTQGYPQLSGRVDGASQLQSLTEPSTKLILLILLIFYYI